MLRLGKFMADIDDWHRGYLFRGWWDHAEIFNVVFAIHGPCLEVEFPSDWHEEPFGWVRIGLGLVTLHIAFPWWGDVVPDEGQCEGPRYGFVFFEDGLHLQWGKTTGRPAEDRKVFRIIRMPWAWVHQFTRVQRADGSWVDWQTGLVDGPPTKGRYFERYPYTYELKNGAVQRVEATVCKEWRRWRRRALQWAPWWHKDSVSIDVRFSNEIGEEAGTWKGGCTGCGYEMIPGETMLDALRRMEHERKF